MVDMTITEDSNPIDLTKWLFPQAPLWGPVNDALKLVFEETPPDAYFSYQYHRNRIGVNPLTIDVSLPLAAGDGDTYTWRTSLQAMIDDLVSSHTWKGELGEHNVEGREIISATAECLREQYERLRALLTGVTGTETGTHDDKNG